MNKTEWKSFIEAQLSALGTHEKAYSAVIDTLSDIMEQRDNIYAEYVDNGCEAVREYTNKFGATNLTKNPLLVLWDDLNKSALAYWRELGLTPSSYKKLTGDNPNKSRKVSGLAKALKDLES